DVHLRHGRRIEWQQLSVAAVRRAHFDDVAGAEIMQRDHRAKLFAGAVDGAQSDQIGMIIFVRRLRLRQAFARDVELCIHEPLSGAAPAAGAALAAAAFAASSLALRSLRGIALCGLLRCVRFMTPAASRKRMMRSDGCAPLAIQALAFSRSNFSRSVLSFGNSGLK